MNVRISRLATVVLVTACAVLALGAQPANANPAEAALTETLKANPGSVRTGESTILLKPGLMVALPSKDNLGTQAVSQCPRGWLCAWPDINYGGPMMATQQGAGANAYVAYYQWWYNGVGTIVYSPSGASPGNGWKTFNYAVTSVYNNTNSIAQAPFHAWFQNSGNYLAPLGVPVSYVGATYNDTFDAACAC